MSLSFEIIIKNFAESVISGIKNNINEKNPVGYGSVNASGNAANSIKYKFDGRTLTVFSTAPYIWALEYGRGPTVNSGGSGKVREGVLKWIDQKGITPRGISKESLAFLISRKIHKEGSLLHKKYKATGKGSGIITDYTNEAFIRKNLTKKLAKSFIDRASETISQTQTI